MVSSILTNNGAMTALQSLKATQKSLLETQNRISTGLKVSTAKDNAATWAVATTMRSDIANYKQVSENLSVSSSILTTAETAATSIASLVQEVRKKVTSAQNPAVDKKQVQADIDALLAQINSTASTASFKGVNLVSGSDSRRILTSVNSVDGVSTAAYTTVSGQNLKVEDGALLSELKNLTVLSRADQTFEKQNDGVTKLTLQVGAGATLNVGNNLNLKYTDATGKDRTLTVKIGSTITDIQSMVNYLNNDSGFKALFKADRVYTSGTTLDAANITISANSRDAVQSFGELLNDGTATEHRTYSAVMTLSAGSGTIGSLNGAATVSGGIRRLDVNFANGPLQLGDTFDIKVASGLSTTLAAETAIYKLKVVDGAYSTGDLLVGDPAYSNNGNVYVIAIAASDVTNPNITGKDIANVMKSALTTGASKVSTSGEGVGAAGTVDFDAAAAAGETFGVSVDATTGTLSILTASGVDDQLFYFNSSKTDYQTLLSKLDSATVDVENAAAAFGTTGKRIDIQKEFLDKLVDTLNTGLGAMVDADMSEEAARLQALQVQEQLGTQALSIANQAPQSILSLFRS